MFVAGYEGEGRVIMSLAQGGWIECNGVREVLFVRRWPLLLTRSSDSNDNRYNDDLKGPSVTKRLCAPQQDDNDTQYGEGRSTSHEG